MKALNFRPEANFFPIMPETELQKLAADITANGQLIPVELWHGDILDGRNRYLAVTRYCPGLELRTESADHLKHEELIPHVVSTNLRRRQLTPSQQAMIASRMSTERRGGDRTANAQIYALAVTQPQAAELMGVSRSSVQHARLVQEKGSPKLAEAVDNRELSLDKATQIVKQYPDKSDQEKRLKIIAESKMVDRMTDLSGEYEWYTPRQYLDAAVEVMGAIDLDPASSKLAQKHVKAGRYFTIEKDGLAQRWSGRVFLNPPYRMPQIRDFTAKMTASWEDGDISEGIMLTNNATDTQWWHEADRVAAAVCFTLGRIHFLEAHGDDVIEKNATTHGQTFFYFGSNPELFRKVFSQFGRVHIT